VPANNRAQRRLLRAFVLAAPVGLLDGPDVVQDQPDGQVYRIGRSARHCTFEDWHQPLLNIRPADGSKAVNLGQVEERR
jgi:hypothetical protein